MLPNVICIGAAKCGTTSLHRYLDLHPEIHMAPAKELDFFAGPGWNWDRGFEWYESNFPSSAPIQGETSNTYTMDPFIAGVPERIAAAVPDARLLYLVGDPIERVISDWVGNRARGWQKHSLEELCQDPDFAQSGYLYRSRYYHQLSRYLEVFPRDAVHVIVKEELAERRRETLRDVFRFLEVADDFEDPRLDERHNPSALKRAPRRHVQALRRIPVFAGVEAAAHRRTGRSAAWVQLPFSKLITRPQLSDSARRRLVEALEPDVAAFRTLTGKPFSHWSV